MNSGAKRASCFRYISLKYSEFGARVAEMGLPQISPSLLKCLDPKSNVLFRIERGKKVSVVGEHHGTEKGKVWLEMRLERGKTGFLPASAAGPIFARPREAFQLIGRKATISGRVLDTRVTNKVIQLKFGDGFRPPFVAVIFRSSEKAFREAGINPAEAYQGREIQVRGKVKSYKWPEIIVRYPDQIQLVQ